MRWQINALHMFMCTMCIVHVDHTRFRSHVHACVESFLHVYHVCSCSYVHAYKDFLYMFLLELYCYRLMIDLIYSYSCGASTNECITCMYTKFMYIGWLMQKSYFPPFFMAVACDSFYFIHTKSYCR